MSGYVWIWGLETHKCTSHRFLCIFNMVFGHLECMFYPEKGCCRSFGRSSRWLETAFGDAWTTTGRGLLAPAVRARRARRVSVRVRRVRVSASVVMTVDDARDSRKNLNSSGERQLESTAPGGGATTIEAMFAKASKADGGNKRKSSDAAPGDRGKRVRVDAKEESVVVESPSDAEEEDARRKKSDVATAAVDLTDVIEIVEDVTEVANGDGVKTTKVPPPGEGGKDGEKKKVHSFFTAFAKRREAVKEAKASGRAVKTETQAEFIKVKPAPIEEALAPIHVGYETLKLDASERTAAVAQAEEASVTTTMTTRPSAAALGDEFKLAVVNNLGGDWRTWFGATNDEATCGDGVSLTSTSSEEREEEYLTSVARMANRIDVERDGAPTATESEIAQTRGELRNRLVGLKARGGEGDVMTQWVDRYKPLEGADVVGENAANVRLLHSWLKAWNKRMAMQVAGKTPPSPSRPCAPRKEYTEDEAEYWERDDDVDDGFGGGKSVANGVLISGPVGSGKSSTVYALAKELGYKVLEVNTLDKRSGQDVLLRFSEATQSKRFNKKQKAEPEKPAKPGLKAFFSATPVQDGDKATTAKKKSDEQATEEKENDGNAQSLILFEEIDIQLASERGFMSALSQLVESTKRPVIFTSNTHILPDLSMHLPLARLRFEAPTVKSCAAYGALVSAAAGATLRPSDAMALALACKGDLRRTIHNAHFTALSSDPVKLEHIDGDKFSTALIEAARTAVNDVSHLGAAPLEAAKAFYARSVQSIANDFSAMLDDVKSGLLRHEARMKIWEEEKEAKRRERREAKQKILCMQNTKQPLELKDDTKEQPVVDEKTEAQRVKEKIQLSLSAFESKERLDEPDWSSFDCSPPAGGWQRAQDEIGALSKLARIMSDVDLLQSSASIGITGVCRRDPPWSKQTIGDEAALEDCPPEEDFYLSNGPPRQTLGGSDNVSTLSSEFITNHGVKQFVSRRKELRRAHPELANGVETNGVAPATPIKASRRARGSTRAPLTATRGSMHPTWRSRLLAECLGGHTVSQSSTTDRLGYISRMIRIQSAPKPMASPSAGRRTRRVRRHLILPSEIRSDLLDVSNFGGSH